MKNFRVLSIVFFSSILLFVISCGEKSLEKSQKEKTIVLDSVKSNIVSVSGELFSIPSPIQTAILIKDSRGIYQPELLNNPSHYSTYETNAEKAMNLGVYGTDMAYSSLYESGQDAISYFKAIDYLAEDLGIRSAISPQLIKRLGANVDNADSLLYLTGRFYEEGDAYLKKNKRYDIAGLILLGGWIESSYLTAQSAIAGDKSAANRLAQQKQSSATLMKVLSRTTDRNFQKSHLYLVLDSIEAAYDQVESTYEFKLPETQTAEKRTVVKSRTNFVVSDSLLHSISNLLYSARTKIAEK